MFSLGRSRFSEVFRKIFYRSKFEGYVRGSIDRFLKALAPLFF